MNCPDWRKVVATRAAEAPGATREGALAPDELDAALLHLERCTDCREAAVAADPLLLFSRLGRREPSRPTADEAMKADVLAMVRASRVAQAPGVGSRSTGGRAAHRTRALRFAAGLVLASLLTLAGGASRGPISNPAIPGGTAPAASAGASSVEVDELAAWIDATALLAQPAVEDLDRPDARIYDLSSSDLAVVMIVDASLDV